jgi:hypothetical protein
MDMPGPTPHAVSGTPPNYPGAPIAEVQILVHGWERGNSEVRVKFPEEAQPGRRGAAANQARFRAHVIGELEDVLRRMEDAAAAD